MTDAVRGGGDGLVPAGNVIRISRDGPAEVSGDIEVVDHDGNLLFRDTRVLLCRCGRSGNKPRCDDSHYPEFAEPGALGTTRAVEDLGAGRLRITVRRNGPLRYEGPLEIVSDDGSQRVRAAKGALCRCGGSKNMPFCDSSHKTNGFTTEPDKE
ncbi:MAG TPA: CDGSH iron-sulfur domain-containing protein [Gemmatimonadales bacterium]